MHRPNNRARWITASVAGVAVAALLGIASWRATQHPRSAASTEPPAAAIVVDARALPPPATKRFPAPGFGGATEGAVDHPVEPNARSAGIALDGWATDPAGIDRVEVSVDEARERAVYGVVPPGVTLKPGQQSTLWAFARPLPPVSIERHEALVTAVNTRDEGTLLGRRSFVRPEAMALWSAKLDASPSLAQRPFTFLMATSGVAHEGADGVLAQYRGLTSRTLRVGIAVPILYMRTTRGAAGDFAFDPAFDLSRRCRDRPVADDNLESLIAYAVAQKVPVNFILNGGIWADASCYSPEWDLTTHLEGELANDQWDQFGKVMPGDYRKNLPGSTASPELSRSLTYTVHNARVRAYKRRNLEAAASIIAAFAREHPELFVGVTLDADTYMNPFVEGGRRYDYNPGMLRQFREWLSGTGPYARPSANTPAVGSSNSGASATVARARVDALPDLSRYRREPPLTLAEVNALAHARWRTWSEVDPPRSFPGTGNTPVLPGVTPFWKDPWYLEWDAFRKHVVQLHYAELAQWAHGAGIPWDRIHTAQAITPHDADGRPVATWLRSPPQYFDSAGVSIEGAKPPLAHLGVLLYGPSASNSIRMEEGHSLFATLARFDDAWVAAEMNATDLRKPGVLPTYAQSYQAFRDLFNFDASQVALMAWNGTSGLLAGAPGYVAYTSWRHTPGEAAMMDFLVSHADLPRGARLWTFGSARLATDDGWTALTGVIAATPGGLSLTPTGGALVLRSPDDQVIRASRLGTLLLRFDGDTRLRRVALRARLAGSTQWLDAGEGQGERAGPLTSLELAWPTAAMAEGAIVEALEISMEFESAAPPGRMTRVLLYPHS